jgi:hypothetical protein
MELVAVAVEAVRERAATCALLAVQEEPSIEALACGRVVERRLGREIGGAEPIELHVAAQGIRAAVPEVDLLDQVLSADDREVVLANDPLGDERTGPTVSACDSACRRDLVVHQDGERAVPVVERAEPIRDAGHPIRAATHLRDRVAGGQNRLEHHTGL